MSAKNKTASKGSDKGIIKHNVSKERTINSKVPSPIQFLTIDNLEVKNQTAFNEFTNFGSSPWITSRRYYRPEGDKMTQIDLLLRAGDFKRAIVHLPQSEKNFVTACRFIVEKAYLYLTKCKNSALGQEVWTTSFQKATIDDAIIMDNRKADILALFGRMYSAEEVHRVVVSEWNVDIGLSAIQNFRTKNLDKIVELQKDYSMNFGDVRLGYKKSRLEEYMWLYNETKATFTNTNSKDDRKFLKELLESIKREVEGDVIRIEGDLQVNIEHTLNVHVQNEIYKKLPINEIIITRVALKTGVNPLLLLYRLQNSYYARFSGFAPKQVDENGSVLPEYPSAHHYDLDKLQQHNNNVIIQNDAKRTEFDKFMEVSVETKTKAQTLKQIIADRIKSRQDDLGKGINQTIIK